MPSSKSTVLIVDDNPDVRTALLRLLSKQSDIEVVGAVESGETACEAAAAKLPDVVLMDVQMPGMGGEEATRFVASQLPAVRVVAISAADDVVVAARMLAAGAVDFVCKTDGMSRIVEAVRNAAETACSR